MMGQTEAVCTCMANKSSVLDKKRQGRKKYNYWLGKFGFNIETFTGFHKDDPAFPNLGDFW